MTKHSESGQLLIPSLRAYGATLPAIIVLGTLSSAAEAVGIGLFIPILAPADGGNLPTSSYLQTFNKFVDRVASSVPAAGRTSIVVSAILAALILKGLIAYANALLSARKNQQIGHELRSQLFSRLLNSGHAFASVNEWGKLLDILSTETWRTTQSLHAAVLIITNSCTIAVFAALLLLLSWQLTLAVTVGMALLSVAMRMFSGSVTRDGEEAARHNGVMMERMVDGILGVRTIEAFNLQNHMRTRFDQSSDRLRAAFLRVDVWSALINPCADISSSFLLLGMLLLSARLRAPWPVLVVTVMTIYRLQAPFRQLETARVNWAAHRGAAGVVSDLLRRTSLNPRPDSKAARTFQGLQNQIVFDQVVFSHPGADKPSLDRVSVVIPRGQVTALVGLSGAGKTTFLNLVCGLYAPSSGEILVDGTPLQEIDLHCWRERIALAGQDVYLFNTTVRENIRLGSLEATDSEIEEAARRAYGEKFLEEFSQGYETEVGDNGGRVSGGQRQRIALARAFLRRPDLLILDEATNALDSISEQRIQTALEGLPDQCTIIVAAHRFSTIQFADHVIVLEQGRVVEQGSPTRLQRQNGLFARLYESQVSAMAEETA